MIADDNTNKTISNYTQLPIIRGGHWLENLKNKKSQFNHVRVLKQPYKPGKGVVDTSKQVFLNNITLFVYRVLLEC